MLLHSGRAGAMVASSTADIPTQLAALLGKRAVQVRKTDETPPRISVIDVATLVTGKNARNAARDGGFVRDRHPEVSQKLSHFLVLGQGQRNTPVACAAGIN